MSLFSPNVPANGEKESAQKVSRRFNYIVRLCVGLGMVLLSTFYIMPNDLFTSALFFDGLGLQPVFGGTSIVFTKVWADLPDLTAEAAAFSLSLLLAQLYAGYQASMHANWMKNDNSNLAVFVMNVLKGKVSIGNANMEKIGWVSMYWAIALFDTWTDTEFRSFFGQSSLFFKAFVVSFFFYSLASEWFLITGSREVIHYTSMLMSEFMGKSKGASSFSGNSSGNHGKKDNRDRQQRPASVFPGQSPPPSSPSSLPTSLRDIMSFNDERDLQ